MANNIKKLNSRLNALRPLLSKDKIELGEIDQEVRLRRERCEDARCHLEKVSVKRKSLLKTMQDELGLDNRLSVDSMTNYRHYLQELDEDLQNAKNRLEGVQKDLEDLVDRKIQCELSLAKKYEYQDEYRDRLNIELDKQQMTRLDELWMSRQIVDKNHE